jgi:uncharacterized protein YndB with AHSA1/START domain
MARSKVQPTIDLRIEINAEVEAVWKALTEAEELTRWFPLQARVTPGTGGSIWASWGEPWAGEARIEGWEPNRHLRTVEPPPQPGGNPLAVDYTLESRGGKTVLRLVHSGFGSGADWEEEYYESVSHGWPFMLASLRHYLQRHPGTPRRVAWPRIGVRLTVSQAWDRLMSAECFLQQGSLDRLDAGDRYEIEAATGDRFQGVVQFCHPPWGFSGTVENLNDSLLWVHIEKLASGPQIWIWLSTFGLPQEEVEAFRDRWVKHLQSLFPQGTIP